MSKHVKTSLRGTLESSLKSKLWMLSAREPLATRTPLDSAQNRHGTLLIAHFRLMQVPVQAPEQPEAARTWPKSKRLVVSAVFGPVFGLPWSDLLCLKQLFSDPTPLVLDLTTAGAHVGQPAASQTAQTPW